MITTQSVNNLKPEQRSDPALTASNSKNLSRLLLVAVVVATNNWARINKRLFFNE
jgi:hypothetical protein